MQVRIGDAEPTGDVKRTVATKERCERLEYRRVEPGKFTEGFRAHLLQKQRCTSELRPWRIVDDTTVMN